MFDLTQVIMEQAMRHGRTVTIKRSEAILERADGKPTPQLVSLKVTADDGTCRELHAPTHAVDGRQLQDQDWMQFIGQMAGELDKLAAK